MQMAFDSVSVWAEGVTASMRSVCGGCKSVCMCVGE